MDQEEVARQVAAYNLLAIPVVDEENKLVGIITVDDVIDVIKDEATEDIYRLAGVAGDERAFTPARESLRKRLPWLGVNLATAFLAAAVVGALRGHDRPVPRRWPSSCRSWPAWAATPRTQTLTVIVRGHRARRADLGQLAQGAAEGSAGRHRQRRRARRRRGAGRRGSRAATRCSGCVLGMAMIINMFVAATAGTLVPLGLRAANIDPALASSVFITTMTDVFGFFSFLGLATVFVAATCTRSA